MSTFIYIYSHVSTENTMVICKYYRQGNCRYGQYCQFEHINNFGNIKAESNEDDIAIMVAKEVLLAERGGQWLLSCFGPLRGRPCIPNMQDLSPEEVRWEMYQARKSGMVEQAKLHFQQLCQQMKMRREMLKNPTRETIAMLKKILESGRKGGLNASINTAGKSSIFSIAAPQLDLANSTSANNIFGNKTFGVQSNNPFGGGGFTSSRNASSIFGMPKNNPVLGFGGALNFGSNALDAFSPATNGTSSVFDGTTNTPTSAFSGVQNNTASFGTSQNNSVFGGSSQSVFGQNMFGNTSSTSLFNNPMNSQTNTSLFGGATTTTASLFGSGSSIGLQTNSVFGASTTSSDSFNGGIFSQSKTQLLALGGAPIFGGVTTNYASNSGNSIFSGNQIFGAPVISTSSGIFSRSTVTTTPAFDLDQQSNNNNNNNNNFGATVSTPNVFGTQNADTAIPVGNSASFGTPPASISGPFVTASSQQFDSTSTNSTPFSTTGLGMAVPSTNNTFVTTETSSNSIFANAGTTFATSNGTVPNTATFSTSTFGNVNSSSPFGSTSINLSVTTANPFAPRTQQNSTPFGNVQGQPGIINASSPFGKSLFNATTISTIVDDSVYSAEGVLTDDEKNIYLAEKFIIGKIPLKPPTKDIR